MNHEAILYVYPGVNGLPSVDPSCCQLLLLINYYNLKNVRVKHHKWCPTLTVPCLTINGQNYHELPKIAKKLKEMSRETLTTEYSEDPMIYPYIKHIEHAFNFTVYMQMHEENVNRQNTVSILKKSYNFPCSMIFARRALNNAEDTLFFYNQTKRGVNWNLISDYLTDFVSDQSGKQFVLSSRTEVDCYLVGKLAPVLLGKYNSNELKLRIDQTKHLSEYITKYLGKFSKHPNAEYELEIQKYNTDSKEEESAATSTVVLATLFAGTAMIVFGIFNGII